MVLLFLFLFLLLLLLLLLVLVVLVVVVVVVVVGKGATMVKRRGTVLARGNGRDLGRLASVLLLLTTVMG
jgi:hypothetical protein